MNVKTKILTSTAVAIALTGGIGATLALADTPTPTPGPSATSSPSASSSPSPSASTGQQAKRNKKHKTLEARALHGQVTLGGKKHQVVEFQRGTVEKISASSVTVKSKDGFTATYVLTAQTKVRKEKKAATVSDLKTTDKIRIVAVHTGSTLTAKTVRDRG